MAVKPWLRLTGGHLGIEVTAILVDLVPQPEPEVRPADCPHVLPEGGHRVHVLHHVARGEGDPGHLQPLLGVEVAAGGEVGRGGDTLPLWLPRGLLGPGRGAALAALRHGVRGTLAQNIGSQPENRQQYSHSWGESHSRSMLLTSERHLQINSWCAGRVERKEEDIFLSFFEYLLVRY